jgi:hypothetical protein
MLLVFVLQIAFGILPVSAPLQLHVEDRNISFALSLLIPRLSIPHLRSTLLAFRLPATLQSFGSHSVEKAYSFGGELPTLLGLNRNETCFLKLLKRFSNRRAPRNTGMFDVGSLT